MPSLPKLSRSTSTADALPLQHDAHFQAAVGSAAAYFTQWELGPKSLQDEIMTMYFPGVHKGATITPGDLASGSRMAAE